ncbi:hypothetical protein [Candidatus Brachybacter algidus]|nr:hypothetical protein [Candidatus Brachybacter algidus]
MNWWYSGLDQQDGLWNWSKCRIEAIVAYNTGMLVVERWII